MPGSEPDFSAAADDLLAVKEALQDLDYNRLLPDDLRRVLAVQRTISDLASQYRDMGRRQREMLREERADD